MKKEVSIIDLIPEEDVASGQHTPIGESLWREPSVGLADDEIQKEALGLTDVPASLHGGEVLDFQGIPENPGLSRELGDDEETDYFGAEAVGVDDMPPENYREGIEALAKLLNEDNLRLKSIIKSANNVKLFVDKTNKEGAMINELDKLEKILRQNGKTAEANFIQSIKKEAGTAGSVVGGMAGITAGVLTSLVPGLAIVPLPIRIMVTGNVGIAIGNKIQDYFESNTRAKTELDQATKDAINLKMKLSQYGVYDQELQQLADGTLSPAQLVDNFRKTGRKTYVEQNLLRLAQQYVDANNKITNSFKQAYSSVGGEAKLPIVERTPVQPPTLPTQPEAKTEGRTGPIASPARSTAKGSITRLGDPFTYDKNPNGEGYIIVSAPANAQHTIGRVIKPGAPGFAEIQAADPAAQKAAQPVAESAPIASETPEAQTPEVTPPISSNDLPVEFEPSKERITAILSKFLNGVPLVMSTGSGQALTSDVKKARRLAERYMKGIADTNDPQERLGIIATTLAEEFGSKIEAGMRERLSKISPLSPTASDVEKEKRASDLRGLFNGLIWQALREAWAKYKNAPLKNAPTEQSEARRLQRLERQDERDARQIARNERRASAKKEARYNLIDQLHKISKS